jgi:hypothetical protein
MSIKIIRIKTPPDHARVQALISVLEAKYFKGCASKSRGVKVAIDHTKDAAVERFRDTTHYSRDGKHMGVIQVHEDVKWTKEQGAVSFARTERFREIYLVFGNSFVSPQGEFVTPKLTAHTRGESCDA